MDKNVPEIGEEVLIEADVMGCSIGKMPYKVKSICVELYGDWGGATQTRIVSLDEYAELKNKER